VSNERYIEEKILQDAKMLSVSTLSFAHGVPAYCVQFPSELKEDVIHAISSIDLYPGVGLYHVDNNFVFDLINKEGKITGCSVYLVKVSVKLLNV
jgi:hypothetical protein